MNDQQQLLDDLKDMITVRIAAILVPAIIELQNNKQYGWAKFLKQYVNRIEPQLNEILNQYKIQRVSR